ncbi:MAG: hypothetical protein RLY93_04590 [Sumerlaeia bacterium]
MNFPSTFCLLALLAATPGLSAAQSFDSGSDGSDGALVLSGGSSGVPIIFDPATFDPPLDPDGDNIYHFTTITVEADSYIRLRSQELGSLPVVWLAQGDVVIDGTLDLSGEESNMGGLSLNGRGGAGGFDGGRGGTGSTQGRPGAGPGGGGVAPPAGEDDFVVTSGSAGHVFSLRGENGEGLGGLSYGNRYLIPLLGGSGGGGSPRYTSPDPGVTINGAGGGGALLIASSTRINLNEGGGRILATGGDGFWVQDTSPFVEFSETGSGAGSGGSVRLIAPTLRAHGSINVNGGTTYNATASRGRVSLEAFDFDMDNLPYEHAQLRRPTEVFPQIPVSVRVTSIDGVPVPANPAAGIVVPDVTVNNPGPMTVGFEARFVPPGTTVTLRFASEDNAPLEVASTPLEGTMELSTATATVTLPRGFAIASVHAMWNPMRKAGPAE